MNDLSGHVGVADQALVNEARSGLHPTGFDPSCDVVLVDAVGQGLREWRSEYGDALITKRMGEEIARCILRQPAMLAAYRGLETAAQWHDDAATALRADAEAARSVGMELSDSCGCLDHYADLHEGHAVSFRTLAVSTNKHSGAGKYDHEGRCPGCGEHVADVRNCCGD